MTAPASVQIPVTRATREVPTRLPLVAPLALGLFLLSATAYGWFSLPRAATAGAGVILLIWLNVLAMIVGLVIEARRRPYSLHMLHLLSLFLFLGVASLYQYSVGAFAVAGPIASLQRQILPAVVAVTAWLIGYHFAYELQRGFMPRRRGPIARVLARRVTPARGSVVVILALVVLVYLASLGLAGAATRASAQEALGLAAAQAGAGGYTQVVYLLQHILLRAFSPLALLMALLLLTRERRSRNLVFLPLVAVAAVGTMITNNPFASARLWFATVAIAFSTPILLRRMRTGWALVTIALFGMAILPSLHEGRYTETINELLGYATLVSPVNYLARSPDVDSLGMLSLAYRWTETHPHQWGLQLLGAILFWVPRAIWPSKPIETGGLVMIDAGYQAINFAPPVVAEPMIDFGLLGIPFVAAAFGVLLARLDHWYWESPRGPGVRVIDCIYPFWLGCVIFITRGGLFSALTFTVGFTAWVVFLAFGRPRSAPGVEALASSSGRDPELSK